MSCRNLHQYFKTHEKLTAKSNDLISFAWYNALFVITALKGVMFTLAFHLEEEFKKIEWSFFNLIKQSFRK